MTKQFEQTRNVIFPGARLLKASHMLKTRSGCIASSASTTAGCRDQLHQAHAMPRGRPACMRTSMAESITP